MERIVQVAVEENALVNIPECLAGLRFGDKLVISKFPDTRTYPSCARFFKGVEFQADEYIRWSLLRNNGPLLEIDSTCFDDAENGSAIKKIRENGYKGKVEDLLLVVYPDMVEFTTAHKNGAEGGKNVYSILVDDKKKDEKIIQEMISKVDRDRIVKMMSVSMERGRKPKDDIVDWFLREWAVNKYEFYLAFGKKLSVSAPIKFKMDEVEMRGSVYALYSKYPKYAATLDLVSSCGLSSYVNNTMPEVPFFSQYFPDIYKRAMNLSKFFSRLFADPAFDLEFSKVMQDREVVGNITISLDPYDFLTSSVNMHGWKSCHSLTGQWRLGPYGYCTDPSSLVVFRDNGKTYDFSVCIGSDNGERVTTDFGKNSFCGNSKSWRQMVHVDKKTCAALFAREYPSNKKIDEVREVARGLLESTLSKYLGISEDWDNFGDLKDMHQKEYFGTTLYVDDTKHHYSDIQNWSSLVRQYTIQKTLIAPKDTDMSKTRIHVGGRVNCFLCGKEIPVNHYGSVFCGNC